MSHGQGQGILGFTTLIRICESFREVTYWTPMWWIQHTTFNKVEIIDEFLCVSIWVPIYLDILIVYQLEPQVEFWSWGTVTRWRWCRLWVFIMLSLYTTDLLRVTKRYIVNVYSLCDSRGKYILWVGLSGLMDNHRSAKWCLCSFFNAICSKNERNFP